MTGLDPSSGFFVTLLVGIALAVAFGYLLEWIFISYLYEREHLQQVLMTYGLILVFEELRSIIVGDDVHGVSAPSWLAGSLPLGDVMTYPVYRLFISAVCLAVAGLMFLVIARTRLGMTHPRRRERTARWCRRWASTSASSTAWCSRPAWRSRRWPG